MGAIERVIETGNDLNRAGNSWIKPLFILLWLISAANCFPQGFVWMHGKQYAFASGVYGVQGVATASTCPGAREGASSWKDGSGNFWMFGGYGIDAGAGADALCDLWKYDPIFNQWTWMKGPANFSNGFYGIQGVPSSSNNPGPRINAASWYDNAGNLWLFGGSGLDAFGSQSSLNDLWKYNIATNQWTWIKGSNIGDQPGVYGSAGVPAQLNTPGARLSSTCWTDAAGNLWLHGGTGVGANFSWGDLNDLWRYDITSNQWTWMKGSQASNQQGVYGIQGISSAAASPGARSNACCWTSNNYFWLYGGMGFDAGGAYGLLNDLWRFDAVTNNWTWIHGNNSQGNNGNYGAMGVSSNFHTPGGRQYAKAWANSAGELILFGGLGFGNGTGLTSVPFGYLNDLWVYTPSTNSWAWVRGANTISQQGNYSSPGLVLPSNMPGARGNGASWIDNANTLWLFGGFGHDDTSSVIKPLNDLWKYNVCLFQNLNISSTQTLLCPGNTATLSASGASTFSWSTGAMSGSIAVSPSVSSTYTVASTDAAGCGDKAVFTQQVAIVEPVSITSSRKPVCRNENFVLTATGAQSYTWNTGQQSASITQSAAATVVYSVMSTDGNGCFSAASFTQLVTNCTDIKSESSVDHMFSIFPNPNAGDFEIYIDAGVQGLKFSIFDCFGRLVFDQVLSSSLSFVSTGLPQGIYTYRIEGEDRHVFSGKISILR